MRTYIRNLYKRSTELISRACLLLFLFFTISSSGVFAQTDSAMTQDSGAVVQKGENELLKNMKKTGTAMTEEVKKMKEKQAHEEFMGYVYMVLGFSLVLVAAWFLVVASNKRKAKADEKKRIFLENKVANQAKSGHRSPHRRGHRR